MRRTGARTVAWLAGGLMLAAVTGAGAQSAAAPKGGGPSAVAATSTARGVVKAVSGTRLVLETPTGGGLDTLVLDDKTVVQRLGKPLTAKDLKAGDAVTVTYAMRDGKPVATRVWVRLAGGAAPNGAKGR